MQVHKRLVQVHKGLMRTGSRTHKDLVQVHKDHVQVHRYLRQILIHNQKEKKSEHTITKHG